MILLQTSRGVKNVNVEILGVFDPITKIVRMKVINSLQAVFYCCAFSIIVVLHGICDVDYADVCNTAGIRNRDIIFIFAATF